MGATGPSTGRSSNKDGNQLKTFRPSAQRSTSFWWEVCEWQRVDPAQWSHVPLAHVRVVWVSHFSPKVWGTKRWSDGRLAHCKSTCSLQHRTQFAQIFYNFLVKFCGRCWYLGQQTHWKFWVHSTKVGIIFLFHACAQKHRVAFSSMRLPMFINLPGDNACAGPLHCQKKLQRRRVWCCHEVFLLRWYCHHVLTLDAVHAQHWSWQEAMLTDSQDWFFLQSHVFWEFAPFYESVVQRI